MSEVVAVAGVVAAVFFSVSIGLMLTVGTVAYLVSVILHRIDESRAAKRGDYLQAELHLMDRYLGYEFPVVEDFTEHLRGALDGKPVAMVQFRERLREKYNVHQND